MRENVHGSPFTRTQLIQQSNIWLNRVVSIRETMPRKLPPSDDYIKTEGHVDHTYTLWGWDRICDRAYVLAIWQLGKNQEVLNFKTITES